ncbi:hypothetical protein EBN03_23585 [Nocardia stercoris]|uniref:LysM peptidoglycan-binding domain-containing protein n=1 Tax=Nocardia stercoris TaxID=2483361 RepID=A0A3M2KZV5_9NOCA|nr:hypothetical protein EBN03_23585 [Nocardia stercoris]
MAVARCQGGSVRPPSRRATAAQAPIAVRAGRPCGAHPLRRVERAQAGLATLAVTALVTAGVVCGLVVVAQVRGGGASNALGHTEIVQVQAGESLEDVAVRIAPDRPVAETVHRIVDLNGLAAGAVAAGRLLVVPGPAR